MVLTIINKRPISKRIMEKLQMVDLKSQYEKIKEEVDTAIAGVINSCAFINGPEVKSFASEMESYLDVNHVLPCANGTDALQIALMALDLQPGDEVITTPFTFIATSEVISLLRLKPVFVDVHPTLYTIDPSKIEAVITDRTKVIIPVHLYGQSCPMDEIMEIANKHGIRVVEDNAQAIGADYMHKDGTTSKTGVIGHIGCTSFFPSKNLGCFGDGGAIFTNDDEIAAKIRMITNHGSKVKYYHEEVGVNSRLDSMQAAILRIKLRHLDEYGASRRAAAGRYAELLKDVDFITTPEIADYSTHVFHQYTMIVSEGRDELNKFLTEKGIPNMIYYPVPLHVQEAYSDCGYKWGDFPIAEDLSKKVLSLPMHTELTMEQQEHICGAIVEFFKTELKAV